MSIVECQFYCDFKREQLCYDINIIVNGDCMNRIVLNVPKSFIGKNIRTYLNTYHVGKKMMYHYSSNHCLLVNDNTVNSEYILKENDRLVIKLIAEDQYNDADSNIVILYEDLDMVVVKKDAGVLVHTDGNDFNSLTDRVNAYYQKLGYQHLVLPVHRIDVETSGMIVFAKHFIALADLSHQFENRTVEKTYIAIVEGEPDKPSGTIRKPIVNEKGTNRMMIGYKGDPAISHYKVLKSNGFRSLVEIKIETGKTHQIRVHMTSIGHSVVGDQLYGRGGESLKLHFKKVSLAHPMTKKRLDIETKESFVF